MVFAGIILLVYTGNGPVVDGIMIVLESIFFTTHMSYMFRGIEDRGGNNLSLEAVILGILCILYYVDPMMKEIIVLTVIAVTGIYYGIIFTSGKMNGDNAAREDDTVDYLYFSHVNEELVNMKVVFPVDISNSRGSMKEGRIKKAGEMLCGKYTGETVFLLERENRYYICPVKKVYALEFPKGDGNMLAGNEEAGIKLLRYEKGRRKGVFSVMVN
jgi:hypothetical protein